MAASILSAKRLREILDYNPETGVFTWRVRAGSRMPGTIAGSPDDLGYIKIAIRKKDYRAHRLAWLYVYGEWPADMVDHIDGNPGNNAITNLRDVSTVVNQQNLRKAKSTNKSGLIGVSRKAKCSTARIKVGGKVLFLGCFKTDEEAHAAYLEAKRLLHSGCTI